MNTRFAKSTGNKIRAFLEVHFVLLFFIAVAGQASIAVAQSSGTFTATGSMTTARAGHTATVLLNGKVLIAGGGQQALPDLVLASAELYDPSSGTFAPTGDMTTARRGHTATLLPDGKVFITGGQGPSARAELYDPSTGTFTATGDMVFARGFLFTATLLGNGKVLIAGRGPTAQLYDPATGTFAVTGAYAGSYACPGIDTATLLLDGRVLITGFDCGSGTVPLTELYDPGTGTFSPAGTMSGTVSWWEEVNTATLLMNGRVLIAGNFENDGFPADAEVYDPSTGTFTGIGNTIAPHEFSTATLLPDGAVLIAGGELPGGNGSVGADLYAPATGTFHAAGNMTTGRHEHTATLLRDGTVLIAGGFSTWPAPDSGAELYRPAGVQGTPTVQIVDHNTGSLTTLAVGDSFSFLVTGAPPSSLVSVSEAGWSGSVGYTDSSGFFRLNGTVAASVVGTWLQTWTIGGVVAQPSPLQFTITPKP